MQGQFWKTFRGAARRPSNGVSDNMDSIMVSVFSVTLGVKKKKARGLIPLTFTFDGGRYKIRTCDPIRVKDMLYP